jgi:hypothetical protein
MDENVQYAILSLYWWISKPIACASPAGQHPEHLSIAADLLSCSLRSVTLLPFATFSLFHVLTFLRTNILPKFAPPSAAPASSGGQATPAAAKAQTTTDKLGRAVQLWVKGPSARSRLRALASRLTLSLRLARQATTTRR